MRIATGSEATTGPSRSRRSCATPSVSGQARTTTTRRASTTWPRSCSMPWLSWSSSIRTLSSTTDQRGSSDGLASKGRQPDPRCRVQGQRVLRVYITALWHDPEVDRYYLYKSAGCSCNEPYESLNGLADLTEVYGLPDLMSKLNLSQRDKTRFIAEYFEYKSRV